MQSDDIKPGEVSETVAVPAVAIGGTFTVMACDETYGPFPWNIDPDNIQTVDATRLKSE